MSRPGIHLNIVLLLSLFTLTACEDEAEPDYTKRTSFYHNRGTAVPTDSLIKCVTYNIQLGFKAFKDPWDPDQTGAGMDQVRSIARILTELDADIVALQEVPLNRSNAEIKEFLSALADALDMNYAFGAHGYNDPYGVYPVYGQWGNAILSRFPIEHIDNHEVEYKSVWVKRSILNAFIKLGEDRFCHAMSLHYLPSEEAILNTADYLSEFQHPVLLMGDFNTGGAIPGLEAANVSDVDSNYNTHGIDRIMINKQYFAVTEIGVYEDSLRVSDHWAHYCHLYPR